MSLARFATQHNVSPNYYDVNDSRYTLGIYFHCDFKTQKTFISSSIPLHNLWMLMILESTSNNLSIQSDCGMGMCWNRSLFMTKSVPIIIQLILMYHTKFPNKTFDSRLGLCSSIIRRDRQLRSIHDE